MKNLRAILVLICLITGSFIFGQKPGSEDTVFIIARKTSVQNRDMVVSKVFEKGQKIIYQTTDGKKYKKGKIISITDSGLIINKKFVYFDELKKIKIDNNFKKAMKITGYALTGVGAVGGVIMTVVTENPVYAIVGVGAAAGGLAMGLSFYKNYSLQRYSSSVLLRKDIPAYLDKIRYYGSPEKEDRKYRPSPFNPQTVLQKNKEEKKPKQDTIVAEKKEVKTGKDFTANYQTTKTGDDELKSAPIPLKIRLIKNRIKVWYPNLYVTDISLSYERRINEHHAFEVGGGYIYNFESPFKSLLKEFAIINDGTNHSVSYNQGLVIRGSYIFYFTSKNFFISPMLLYKYTEQLAEDINEAKDFPAIFNRYHKLQSEVAHTIGLSALIGRQWTIGNLFSIDAFIGPGIKFKSSEVTIHNDDNFHSQQQYYPVNKSFKQFYPDLQFGFKLGFCFYDITKKK
jgi:hypothetical protein